MNDNRDENPTQVSIEPSTGDKQEDMSITMNEAPSGRQGKRKLVAYLLIGLVIVSGIGLYAFLSLQSEEKKASMTTNSVTEQPAESGRGPTESNVPDSLLAGSQVAQGYSVGYVKKISTNHEQGLLNRLFPKVHAQSVEYQSTLFYKQSGGNGEQIYGYDINSGESRQITSAVGNASNPVFSSIEQALAYSVDSCQLSILNFTDGSDRVVKSPQEDACSTPVAWSPDGKKLVFRATKSTQSELGLVGITTLYLYDVINNEVTELELPDGGYNSASGQVSWTDDDHLVTKYVQYGQYASILKEQVIEINLQTKVTTRLSGASLQIESLKYFNGGFFAISSETNQILNGPGVGDMRGIVGTEGTKSFLISPNKQGWSLVGISGEPGSEGSMKLFSQQSDIQEKKQLYTPGGFSAYLIGWGSSYDEIIYMNVASGKSEMHKYTISKNENKLLIDGLPLVQ